MPRSSKNYQRAAKKGGYQTHGRRKHAIRPLPKCGLELPQTSDEFPHLLCPHPAISLRGNWNRPDFCCLQKKIDNPWQPQPMASTPTPNIYPNPPSKNTGASSGWANVFSSLYAFVGFCSRVRWSLTSPTSLNPLFWRAHSIVRFP